MCTSYSGYSNYPTWAVSLWIDNDQGLYEMTREWAQDCDGNAYKLENELREFFNKESPTIDNDVFSDLLQFALDSVDWWEIARDLLGEIEEENESDEEESDGEG